MGSLFCSVASWNNIISVLGLNKNPCSMSTQVFFIFPIVLCICRWVVDHMQISGRKLSFCKWFIPLEFALITPPQVLLHGTKRCIDLNRCNTLQFNYIWSPCDFIVAFLKIRVSLPAAPPKIQIQSPKLLDKTVLPSQGCRAVLYFCTRSAEEQKQHFSLLPGTASSDRFLLS